MSSRPNLILAPDARDDAVPFARLYEPDIDRESDSPAGACEWWMLRCYAMKGTVLCSRII